jgi:hypothetical protein
MKDDTLDLPGNAKIVKRSFSEFEGVSVSHLLKDLPQISVFIPLKLQKASCILKNTE